MPAPSWEGTSSCNLGFQKVDNLLVIQDSIASWNLIRANVMPATPPLSAPNCPCEQDLLPSETQIVQVAGGASMLSPHDWQVVGSTPEFYVNAREPVRLRLFDLQDWKRNSAENAAVVSCVVPRPYVLPGISLGRPSRPLPEGDYIVALDDEFGEPISQSGFCVRARSDARQQYFKETLREQSKRLVARFFRSIEHFPTPLFSITTTVYNTAPTFLYELADCLLRQSFSNFEWLLLENGSTMEETKTACRGIANRDARVRYFEVAENLHIIGGNRYLLERAKGKYVVPVDSDDIVYPCALEIIAEYIVSHRFPDLLYSDEFKVSISGTPVELLWRPAWSTLFATATCPASHLMIFLRELALKVGAYTGPYARGSHDWDTALRLDDSGQRPAHIPKVLYGWRMHPGSAAMNEDSKNYLAQSQLDVVRSSVSRRGLSHLFDVEAVHGPLGYYHLRRKQVDGPRVAVHYVFGPQAGPAQFGSLRENLTNTRYSAVSWRIYVSDAFALASVTAVIQEVASEVHDIKAVVYRSGADLPRLLEDGPWLDFPLQVVVNAEIQISDPEWLWDAVGTFDLDPQCGIVGGCLLDPAGKIRHIGYAMGLEGFAATPGYDLDPTHVWGAIANLRRNVVCVYGSFTAFRTETWKIVGPLDGLDKTDGLYGIQYCLKAGRHAIRTAYTPRMKGIIKFRLQHPVGSSMPRLQAKIKRRYRSLIHHDPFYSKHCSLSATAYGSVSV